MEQTSLSFDDLCISSVLCNTLISLGFLSPSPIQARCIPIGLTGNNVIAQAKSGTGKTIAFTTIVLERINVGYGQPQALVIAPTRELAVQIDQVFQQLSAHLPGFRTVLCIGGTSTTENAVELRKACHVVIGTPGRIENLVSAAILHTDALKMLVLDEADRLLESSMMEAVAKVWASAPSTKQILAFSATYSQSLQKQLQRLLPDAEFIRVLQEAQPEEERPSDSNNTSELVVSKIKQAYVKLRHLNVQFDHTTEVLQMKLKILVHILQSLRYNQAIVFVNRGSVGQVVSRLLTQAGIANRFTSAELSQQQRLEVFYAMQEGQESVLISTDLSSRGIDIEGCSLVVNYDVPMDIHTYVHRIGRTGRFGANGCAISLVSEQEESTIDEYARKLDVSMLDLWSDLAKVKEVLVGMDDLQERLKEMAAANTSAPTRIYGQPQTNNHVITDAPRGEESSTPQYEDDATLSREQREENLYRRWRKEAAC